MSEVRDQRPGSAPKRRPDFRNPTTAFLACLFELDWFFDEIERACSFHLAQVALVYREQAALVRSILVYAASRGAVAMFLEKRAFEKYLATGTAAIALSASERQLLDNFLFAKVRTDKASYLALNLSRAKLCIFDCPRAQPLCQTFLD
jgi:hypothetical protein